MLLLFLPVLLENQVIYRYLLMRTQRINAHSKTPYIWGNILYIIYSPSPQTTWKRWGKWWRVGGESVSLLFDCAASRGRYPHLSQPKAATDRSGWGRGPWCARSPRGSGSGLRQAAEVRRLTGLAVRSCGSGAGRLRRSPLNSVGTRGRALAGQDGCVLACAIEHPDFGW